MQSIIKEYIEKVLDTSVVLEKPKDISLGHFATPVAFSLAKELRKSPMMIADDLVKKFDDNSMFEKIEAVKGFINFKLSNSFLEKLSKEALLLGNDFAKETSRGTKIIWSRWLDFVFINVNRAKSETIHKQSCN